MRLRLFSPILTRSFPIYVSDMITFLISLVSSPPTIRFDHPPPPKIATNTTYMSTIDFNGGNASSPNGVAAPSYERVQGLE